MGGTRLTLQTHRIRTINIYIVVIVTVVYIHTYTYVFLYCPCICLVQNQAKRVQYVWLEDSLCQHTQKCMEFISIKTSKLHKFKLTIYSILEQKGQNSHHSKRIPCGKRNSVYIHGGDEWKHSMGNICSLYICIRHQVATSAVLKPFVGTSPQMIQTLIQVRSFMNILS